MSRSVATSLAVLLATGALLVGPAGASSPAWSPAHSVKLPGRGESLPQGFLPALACGAPSSCVAAGDFQDANQNIVGLVVRETRGRWSSAVALGVPADAAPGADATPYAAACGAAGDCVIVGNYNNAAGNVETFIDQEIAGAWKKPYEVVLPSDASPTSTQVAQLRAVACSSATQCVAVGSYPIDAAGSSEGLVVSGGSGDWSAHGVAPPSGANVDPVANLAQVACGAGTCSAVGTYLDADNATHPMVVTTSATTATALALPGNASAYPSASIGGLACPGAGSCAVDGTYETAGGQLEAFAAASSTSAWGPATELALPAGAAANPRAYFYGYTGLACHGVGQCATGGLYLDHAGRFQGFVDDEVGGAWRVATTLRLPAGAAQAGRNGGVVAVTCPGNGACRVGAAYLDAKGQYEALVAAERHDVWSTGAKLVLPAGAESVGVDGGVYGLVCGSTTTCTATGSYLDSSGKYQGFYSTLG